MKSAVQRVEEGKKRLEELRTRHTRAQTILEAETAKRDEALAVAEIEYEVKSLPALKALLAKREAENEAQAEAFCTSLDEANRQLQAVEAQLAK